MIFKNKLYGKLFLVYGVFSFIMSSHLFAYPSALDFLVNPLGMSLAYWFGGQSLEVWNAAQRITYYGWPLFWIILGLILYRRKAE